MANRTCLFRRRGRAGKEAQLRFVLGGLVFGLAVGGGSRVPSLGWDSPHVGSISRFRLRCLMGQSRPVMQFSLRCKIRRDSLN